MPETIDEIKKYVGPFSGPQMDQIFYEILNYTSERYAKGTANSLPVAPGTPGYQDNSLYYKNQAAAQAAAAAGSAAAAESAATRAESAVPAGTDSAVLFTQEQQLTTAEQEQARFNITAGGTNPNLIDNPWFTIQQRGAGPFGTGQQYTVDRWKKLVNGSISADGSGVAISPTASTGYIELLQYTDSIAAEGLEAKTLTLSVMLNDGSVKQASGVVPATPASGTAQFISIQIRTGVSASAARRSNGGFVVEIIINQAQMQETVIIKAIKLEVGAASTISNDAPPNYAEELAKCQRYCYVIAASEAWTPICMAYFSNANGKFSARLPLPVPMRAKPSISISGTFRVVLTTGSTYQQLQAASITGAGAVRMNGAELRFDGTITGGSTGNIGEVNSEDATTKIILSADL